MLYDYNHMFLDSLANLLDQLAELHSAEAGPDRLCREAAQGHIEVVKEIVTKYPDKVGHYVPGQGSCYTSDFTQDYLLQILL